MNKTSDTTPVIVLGMAVTGLAVARALGRRGIRVYAMDSDAAKPTLATRYAHCMVCPDVHTNPEDFKKYLLDVAQKIYQKCVGINIPTSSRILVYFKPFVNRIDKNAVDNVKWLNMSFKQGILQTASRKKRLDSF